MATGFNDAMRFAPGNNFPVTYRPDGLPDFGPPPRHPLEDALDEIMRIYAPLAPRSSGPFDRQTSGTDILSSIGSWPVFPYAAQPPVPVPSPRRPRSDDPLVNRVPLDSPNSSLADLDGVGQLPDLDSAKAPGAQQLPSSDTAPWLEDINPEPSAATAQQANSEPTPETVTTRPLSAMRGWPYSEADDAEREIPRPAVTMPQPAGAVADSNLILTNVGDAQQLQAQQRALLPHDQATELKNLVRPSGVEQPNDISGSRDPWRAGMQQQALLPEDQQTGLNNVPEIAFGTDSAVIRPAAPAGASPIEPSVYRPDIDPVHDDLFDLVGVKENKIQGDAARDAAAERIKEAHPDAPLAKEIRAYVKGVEGYTTVDIMFRPNGTSAIMIYEVKSGTARLSQQQLATFAQALRTGEIYIVNEDAAKKFGLRPYETFASKSIIPFVYIVGGDQDAIMRQLAKLGIEVVREKPRRGQAPRLRVVRPI
jgi:hypothetical protein